MRRVPALPLAACLAVSALALSAGAAFAANGELGGGFLEMLLTGSAHSRPSMSSPAPVDAVQAPVDQQTAALTPGEVEVGEPPQEYRRQVVEYSGREAPGTIIIDTEQKFLYLVEPGGQAIRYGVGVGRPGFEWAGVRTITRKAEWPGWTPPEQMLLRRPDLPRHMDGGPDNPLGARALYLGSTLYRIHGTNEPDTIGRNMSSGCIRMMNQDVIDLYNRVRVGTRVVVM